MINVIELDQWSATAKNLKEMDFDTFNPRNLKGGDSEAVKDMCGGSYRRLKVKSGDKPDRGYIWYVKGLNGKLEFYQAKYNSSD